MSSRRKHDSEAMEFAFFEGEIVPFKDANISIGTHAIQYGTGAFGAFAATLSDDGKTLNIFRLRDHTTRLLNSARMLRMDLPFDPDSLAKVILELTRANKPTSDTYYRPFVYKSSIHLSPSLQHLDDDIAIYMMPLGAYLDLSRGQRVIVSSWTRASDNMIPSRGKFTGSYVGAAFAKDQATAYGMDDALMLNEKGKISEASSCNFFMVRNGVLITTPITASILEGITRRSVLQVAEELGIPTETREIDRTEVYIADEAFFCGTGVQVAWIEEIDGRKVGDGTQGPITKQLYDALFGIYRSTSDLHREWLTKVDIG